MPPKVKIELFSYILQVVDINFILIMHFRLYITFRLKYYYIIIMFHIYVVRLYNIFNLYYFKMKSYFMIYIIYNCEIKL
jgi:hypothetical protein